MVRPQLTDYRCAIHSGHRRGQISELACGIEALPGYRELRHRGDLWPGDLPTPLSLLNGRGRDEDCSSPPAQIPACGFPAPGSCLGSNVIGLRGMGYPCSSDPWARRFRDMLVPALGPGHASQLTLPSTGRLPSTVSAADVTRHCSRLLRYYAAVRLLIRVHAHRSAVAFMGRSGVLPGHG